MDVTTHPTNEYFHCPYRAEIHVHNLGETLAENEDDYQFCSTAVTENAFSYQGWCKWQLTCFTFCHIKASIAYAKSDSPDAQQKVLTTV